MSMETSQAGGRALPRELRLAVSMRGGVSLAVWMGGACQEIERLRRALGAEDDASAVYRKLLRRASYDEVVVDVLAGTSAGGLNAVLLSCSVVYDMPFDSSIRNLWLQVADIERLCRDPQEPSPRSLLQGDGVFYADLMDKLRRLLENRLEHPRADRRVDLILTCTLLNPVPETFYQPIGAPIVDARSRAHFRFRHFGEGAAVSDFRPPDHAGDESERWEPIRRLAYAARSTSSYPGAFEPAAIWVAPEDRHASDHGSREPFPQNMYGVFSESRTSPSPSPDSMHVIDGGVLDNIPVAWAIRSIAGASANRPVDRWLLYLQPVPPGAPASHDNAKAEHDRLLRLLPVAKNAHDIKLSSESLLDDVQELRRYSVIVGQRRQVADALATTPLVFDALLDKARQALQTDAPVAYRKRQGAVEAARLARLLEAPIEVTGPDPLPFGGELDPLRLIEDKRPGQAAELLAFLTQLPNDDLADLALPAGATKDLERLHTQLRSLQAVAQHARGRNAA
jgi:patatin-related protein